MKYFKITATTPYYGADAKRYIMINELACDAKKTAHNLAIDLRDDTAEEFEYMIGGWDYEPTEEELADYYAGCECEYEEIDREEYMANADDE